VSSNKLFANATIKEIDLKGSLGSYLPTYVLTDALENNAFSSSMVAYSNKLKSRTRWRNEVLSFFSKRQSCY
jgi:hypothetical protein